MNKDEIEACWQENLPRLRGFLAKHRAEDREDLLQRVFVIVWEKQRKFQENGKTCNDVLNFSLTTARFLMFRARRSISPGPLPYMVVGKPVEVMFDGDDVAPKKAALSKCLQESRGRFRNSLEIFTRRIEGRSWVEIGSEFKESETAVRLRHRRFRDAVLACLKREGIGASDFFGPI